MGTTDSSGGLALVGAYAGLRQLSVRKDGYVTHQTTIQMSRDLRGYEHKQMFVAVRPLLKDRFMSSTDESLM